MLDVDRLNRAIRDNQESKERALAVMRRLTPDSYLANAVNFYETSLRQKRSFYLLPDVLNLVAHELGPNSYLEIGVRRGRSMAQVMVESPHAAVYGFDMWVENYAGQENPGPKFVCDQMRAAGASIAPRLITGDSHKTVPRFFKDHGCRIELITVDGDHTYVGAKRDLDVCFENLAPGGMLIFDDLYHPQFPELAGLWDEYKKRLADHAFLEDKTATGTALAIRPPFDRYESLLQGLT